MINIRFSTEITRRVLIPVILFQLYACCAHHNGIALPVVQMADTVFARGMVVNNDHFTGTVWLNMLVNADSTFPDAVGAVTFAPGARTNWHNHPGGQILLVTGGTGLYQEKGKPVQFLRKGMVVKCTPNTSHWHGASHNDMLSHVAIAVNAEKGVVVWEAPVTEAEYREPAP